MEKLKVEIKKWEKAFAEVHGKKPEKEDIKTAPDHVKLMYKDYWRMRKDGATEKPESPESVWDVKHNKGVDGHKVGKCSYFKEKVSKKMIKYELSTQPFRSSKSSTSKKLLSGNSSLTNVQVEIPAEETEIKYSTLSSSLGPVVIVNPRFEVSTTLEAKVCVKKSSVLSGVLNNKPMKLSQFSTSLKFSEDIDSEIDGKFKFGSSGSQKDFANHESSQTVLSTSDCPSELSDSHKDQNPISVRNSRACDGDSEFLQSNVRINYNVSNSRKASLSNHHSSLNEDNPESSEVLEKIELDSVSRKSMEEDSNPENQPLPKIRKQFQGNSSRTCETKFKSLKRKIASGTVNDNYVRVNIKKKRFSRGHQGQSYKKFKWQKWKNKAKNGGFNTNSSTCFKCGKAGHWANACKTGRSMKTLPYKSNPNSNEMSFSDVCRDDQRSVPPFYTIETPGNIPEPTEEVLKCMKKFGYIEFRHNQDKAIMRILCGLSTLLILPTGGGKSLCYQLPAYLYAQKNDCITLVISPLVSLMEDQVSSLPSGVSAVCLHSGMTETQKTKSLDTISKKKAHILFVSPEFIVCGRNNIPADLPPIAFACIDEAHCLSEWSHNFRPSYLQLCKALKRKLHVNCILCLTATATDATSSDIVKHLGLKKEDVAVLGYTAIPSNLHISVSSERYKDEALIELLQTEPFSTCFSIIIYCTRRDETERLAALIRTRLQNFVPLNDKKSDKSQWSAEAYHAGLTPNNRKSVQKRFMKGKVRVVVATVAFGMGLNKPDIRAVIHYNMPRSFESYVQEIGRSGRDGKASYCHVFLEEGTDLNELRRYIYSDSVDRIQIKRLLHRVFDPCRIIRDEFSTCEELKLTETPSRFEVAFPINGTVHYLDLKEESISTLLCYLELHSSQWIELLLPTYSTCTVHCYGGSDQMKSLVNEYKPLKIAMAIDKQMNKFLDESARYQFNIIDAANLMNCDSIALKRDLRNLQWKDNKRSGILTEFSDLSFHILVRNDVFDAEMDKILDFLHAKCQRREQSELNNLNMLHEAFRKHSFLSCLLCYDKNNDGKAKSDAIKETVKLYFDNDGETDNKYSNQRFVHDDIPEKLLVDIKKNICEIICTNPDQRFTGRAIARILHGISSPCYPAEVWGRLRKHWRSYLNCDFNELIKIANEELKRMK